MHDYPMDAKLFEPPFAQVIGWGKALPANCLSNHDLARRVNTSDEWIRSRTGICTRYICKDESCTDLAERAAQAALEKAGLVATDVDLILLATLSSETRMPATACRVAARLGASRAIAFDLSAACSGFVYAMITAQALLRQRGGGHALIIGAERLSHFLDWEDRNSCVLFGDGAGAVLLRCPTTSSPPFQTEAAGLQAYVWGALSEDQDALLSLREEDGKVPVIRMQGQAVFKFAVNIVPALLEQLLLLSGVSATDLDWVVGHQANSRILDLAAEKSAVPRERWFMNLDRYGNTSAASIPMALAELADSGQLRDGQKMALLGFGGGLTYGGLLLNWGK